MKSKFIKFIFTVLWAAVLVSCMKNDEVEVSPQCAIVSFGVSSIISYVSYTTSSGETVTMKKTVAGSDVLFDIDQNAGTIKTATPLPNWISLTKVVPVFSTYGTLYYVSGDNRYTMTSGSDSLDFTEPRTLVCVSTDGLYSKNYTVTFEKNSDVSDTIVWETVNSNFELKSDKQRALVVSATYKDKSGADSLVRRMFMFTENEDGQSLVTSTTERSQATTWTLPATLMGADGTIDYRSVTVHDGVLYALDDQQKLYKSTEAERGIAWTKVSDAPGLTTLLASDGKWLYGYDGTDIVATTDFINWKNTNTPNTGDLPQSSIYNFYRTSYTNSNITLAMMGGMGTLESGSPYGVSWYKTTQVDADEPGAWSYINISGDNEYGCPALQEASTVIYNDYLYMMGRNTDNVYEGFYRSEDNGISWHLQSTVWLLPEALDGENGAASMVLLGKDLYVMQKGGNIWRGYIK